MSPQELWNWYYTLEEKAIGTGFFLNPYRRWHNAQFQHVFAFDAECNLYVGQFSVYPDHLNKLFGSKEQALDVRECGFLHLHPRPHVVFDEIEHRNIIYLNRRLKKMSQRFYDYGMPERTIILARQTDLGNPDLFNILRGEFWERPDKEKLKQML